MNILLQPALQLKLPAIRGIGGAILYLIDRYEDGASIYDIDFEGPMIYLRFRF